MAQIIKHRRGSLEKLSEVTGSLQKGELVLATGSANLTTTNGTGLSFIVPESGSVQATNRFLMGSANPNIFSASIYNGMLKGVPYYASGSSTLFLLGSDGNEAINLVGNIQVFSQSVDSRLDTVEASLGIGGGSIGTRVTNLETISASYLAFTSSYYTDSSSVATQFSASSFTATANSASGASVFNTLSGSVYTQISASGASVTSLSASVAVTNNGQTDRLGSIETYTSSLKDAITVSGSGTDSTVTIKGNLLVQGTQTTVDSTTIQLGDNIIELNGSGAANGGLLVKDVTNPNTVSGSLLWDSTNDYWKAGALGSEKQLANVDFVSTSVSVLSQSVDTRLLTVESSLGSGGSVGTRVTNLETISASYLAFTSSYYTTSGSFDTRISASSFTATVNSSSAATSFSASLASQTALSASISTTDNTQTDNITTNSASAAGVFASASAFSSSAATALSASIFNTTINSASIASTVNTLSGSVYTQFSASTFTATVNSSSAATSFSASLASQTALSASISTTNNTQTDNITTNSASAAGAFASASAYSGSAATSFSASLASQTALSASISTTNNTQTDNISTVSASAWGAFQTASANSASAATSFSASIFTATVNSSSAATSFSASLATAVANSASAATDFNTLSGSAYTQFSASAASVSANSASSATSFSASLASQTALSASNATTDNGQTDRIVKLEASASNFDNAITLSGVGTGSVVTIKGSLTIQGTTTQVDSTTINLGDNILQLNAAGTSDGGLIVRDATGGSTVSGSLLWDVTTDYWKAGKAGSESKVLLATDDNVFTSSIQTALSGTFGYATYSQSVATSFSASNASITNATDILSSSVATSFSASAASVTALSASNALTDNTQTDNIGIISASAWGAFTSASAYSGSAATNFNTLSGSAYTQFSASAASVTVNSASAATSFSASLASQVALSSSVDSRLDTLEGTGTIQGVGTTNAVSFSSVTASLNVPGGSSTKRLAFRGLTDNIEFIAAPTQSGDIAQWNGTDFVMSNTLDGGSF